MVCGWDMSGLCFGGGCAVFDRWARVVERFVVFGTKTERLGASAVCVCVSGRCGRVGARPPG